jgi:hypothetical protein
MAGKSNKKMAGKVKKDFPHSSSSPQAAASVRPDFS